MRHAQTKPIETYSFAGTARLIRCQSTGRGIVISIHRAVPALNVLFPIGLSNEKTEETG